MAITMGDGSIVLTTKVDEKGLKQGTKDLEKEAKKLAKEYVKAGMSQEEAMKKAKEEIEKTTEETKKSTKETEKYGKEAEKSGNKAKNAFSAVGKAFAAVGAAAATAFTALATSAINSYAEFEQLSGGVQKIFNEIDYSKIAEDAGNAYKTMGMSANEYLGVMTTVGANFASTLGDAKGYEVAKQGMQAISDFASGTGRSVDELSEKYQMITKSTSSYQSIADQFAGILPATSAGFLEQAQAAGFLSESYTKLTDVPMAEYQEVVTQMLSKGVDALGLTGNTAMEASTTLSGATAMMKSSWQNLLTGMADENQNFDVLLENFINSIGAVMQNLLPRISVVLGGVLKLVEGLLPQIPSLIQQLLPMLIEGTMSLVQGLSSILPDLITTIVQMLPTLLPLLINGVVQLILGIINAIDLIIQPIIDVLPDLIISVVGALVNNLPALIQGIISLIMGIVQAMPLIIQALVDALPTIIEMVLTALLENLPFIIEGLVQVVLGIVQATPQIIQSLVDALPTIIEMILTALLKNLPLIIGGLVKVVAGIVQAIPQIFSSMIKAIVSVFAGIWNSLKVVFGQLGNWIYKNVVAPILSFFDKIWEGIKTGVKTAINFVIGIINGLIGGFEGFVNIFVKGINLIIDGLNKISFDIPDWIPLIGGKKFGFNLPKMSQASFSRIPKLAQGAVIPPNREFMAILGDQKHGTNIEAPLDTIKQAVAEVLAQVNTGFGGSIEVPVIIDGREVARAVRQAEGNMGSQTVFGGFANAY